MNFEHVKSITLTILIITSAVLTWNIWTTQPEYEDIDPNGFIPVKTEEKEINDILKLKGILFHSGGSHFQMTDSVEMDKFQANLSKWTLNGYKDVSSEKAGSAEEFSEFLHSEANTEILLTDEVPFKTFSMLLNGDEKDLPRFSFDRIVFQAKESNQRDSSIYFVSTKSKEVIESKLNGADMEGFYQTYYKKAQTLPEYESYKVSKERTLFILKEKPKLEKLIYSIKYVNLSNLKKALFDNPSEVRTEKVEDGEEFSDDGSLMTVRSNSLISYVDTTEKGNNINSFASSEIIQQSINHVNNHAGWEDNKYQFAGLNENNQSIFFQLFIEGIPVFNELGMSQIEQVWGNANIYRYKRPAFALDFPLQSDGAEVELPTGREAIKALEMKEGFQLSKLQDLVVGYHLSKPSSDDKFVTLEPAWYYRSGDTWAIVSFAEPGGE